MRIFERDFKANFSFSFAQIFSISSSLKWTKVSTESINKILWLFGLFKRFWWICVCWVSLNNPTLRKISSFITKKKKNRHQELIVNVGSFFLILTMRLKVSMTLFCCCIFSKKNQFLTNKKFCVRYELKIKFCAAHHQPSIHLVISLLWFLTNIFLAMIKLRKVFKATLVGIRMVICSSHDWFPHKTPEIYLTLTLILASMSGDPKILENSLIFLWKFWDWLCWLFLVACIFERPLDFMF